MRLILAIKYRGRRWLRCFLLKRLYNSFLNSGIFVEKIARTHEWYFAFFAIAMPFHAMISLVTRALNVIGNTTATFRVAFLVGYGKCHCIDCSGFGRDMASKVLACANAFAALGSNIYCYDGSLKNQLPIF
jgi:hypothetical protein